MAGSTAPSKPSVTASWAHRPTPVAVFWATSTTPVLRGTRKHDFLVLFEDSIKTLNVSNGPVKYQDAIQATKVRLNFAVGRGVLLLPARMIINTESVVGYNNNLRRATDDMKLGVNNHVNQGTKKASLKLMAGGPSKVNPPNSHPSNPIHKQATEAQGIAPKPTATPAPPSPTQPATPPAQPQVTATTEPVDSHHVNKALVAVGALAVVGLIITPLLKQPFHEEGHHGKDEQPGVLRQEGENLARGFEDEAHDRADESGQEGAQLLANSLRAPCPTAFVPALSPFSTSKGKSAENNADSQSHGLQGPAILLEDVLDPLPQGQLCLLHAASLH